VIITDDVVMVSIWQRSTMRTPFGLEPLHGLRIVHELATTVSLSLNSGCNAMSMASCPEARTHGLCQVMRTEAPRPKAKAMIWPRTRGNGYAGKSQ